MKPLALSQNISRAKMPILWQIIAIFLLISITTLLFIDNSIISYTVEIIIATFTICAVTTGYFFGKKSFYPWGFLLTAIILINSSFIFNSLIFFGVSIPTHIPLWLEESGIVFTAFFSCNLLYLFEKQYNLKGVTIDTTLIGLATTCLVFLVSPNLLDIVIHKLQWYEQLLVFHVVLGSIFIALVFMASFLSKKIKLKDILLSVMVLSLSTHFYLDAYISFNQLSNSGLLSKVSWFLYQLPAVLTIFHIFSEEFEYNFKLNKTKKMGVKLLWIGTIIGTLIVPLGVIYRWLMNLSSIDTFAIATISGIMSLIVILRVIILISNYEKQRQKLKFMAFTDSLTGISNYLGLKSGISKFHNLLVICIDIEDFKSINDMYDRKFGDQVLISLARRINNASGVIHSARTTGDNFLVVFQTEERHIYDVFLKFEKEIGVWDTIFNRRVAVPVTYGGSHSKRPNQVDKLVRNAEIGLKKSRVQKRQFTLHQDLNEFLAPSATPEIPRHELREILQRSIDNSTLPIHFQPIYKIQTGELTALEMLIRVNSSKHGLLVPGQFLEQAKSYGLLTDLTRTCISMIAQQIYRLPNVTININVPPYMLDDHNTLNDFINCFKTEGLSTRRFCIEVTEDGDIPTERLVPAIKLLKDAGFTIAMDDFGTGYSSLGRLSTLPVDSVKIDRSLLIAADNGNKTILESAINLVKRLGVVVVVEGVETIEQLALVKSLGADSVQGFLFSKPVQVKSNKQFSLNAADIVAEF